MLSALKHPEPAGTARFIRHGSPQLILQRLKNSYNYTTLRDILQFFLSLKVTPAILTPFLHLSGSNDRLWEEDESCFDKEISNFCVKLPKFFAEKQVSDYRMMFIINLPAFMGYADSLIAFFFATL
ncbi:hypothetical protein [Pantoea conspicua]|uniref:hypothetical protein n=1 Tax=Pantoea conspicua TaxID=472705 RepID=UPI00138FD0CC|nr:hypothetical protein [Pantoea conspicua]